MKSHFLHGIKLWFQGLDKDWGKFVLSKSGGMAERSMAADCKSADERLRRFESYSLHHGFVAVVPDFDVGNGLWTLFWA